MLFAVACPVLGEGLICVAILVLLLLLDQVIDTVECDAAVVADDAATAVCIGKAGDDVRGTRCTNARSVDIEDSIVVSLAVLGKDLLDLGVNFLTSFLDGGLNHAPAAIGHHRTLEGGISLQTDDNIVVLADVAGLESVNVRGGVGVNIEDANLTFLRQVVLFKGFPHAQGLFRRPGEEGSISFVRGVVALNEVTHVDFFGPVAPNKTVPCVGSDVGGLLISHFPSSRLPWLSG